MKKIDMKIKMWIYVLLCLCLFSCGRRLVDEVCCDGLVVESTVVEILKVRVVCYAGVDTLCDFHLKDRDRYSYEQYPSLVELYPEARAADLACCVWDSLLRGDELYQASMAHSDDIVYLNDLVKRLQIKNVLNASHGGMDTMLRSLIVATQYCVSGRPVFSVEEEWEEIEERYASVDLNRYEIDERRKDVWCFMKQQKEVFDYMNALKGDSSYMFLCIDRHVGSARIKDVFFEFRILYDEQGNMFFEKRLLNPSAYNYVYSSKF